MPAPVAAKAASKRADCLTSPAEAKVFRDKVKREGAGA